MREITIKLLINWDNYDDVCDELIVEDAIELKDGVSYEIVKSDSKKNEGATDVNNVLMTDLFDLQQAEATVEFMNLFRQILNEARFFSYDERSLRKYLIEDIERKKLKAEEFLKKNRNN